MAQNNVFRVTLVGSFRNQTSINVLHYYQSSILPATPPDVAYLNLAAAVIAGTVGADLRACMSQESTYDGLLMRWLAPNPDDDLQVQNVIGAGTGDADAPGTCPSQVCGLIRKRGPYAARRSRGRMYVPFPPAAAFDDDDLVASAYLTVLTDLAATILSEKDFTYGDEITELRPCLVGTSRLSPIIPVIATDAAGGFATQRRRGYFGRPNNSPLS